MSITVVGIREIGWMDTKLEKYLWRDSVGLGIDNLILLPNEEYDSVKDIPFLGKKIFFEVNEHPRGQSLYSYEHPDDAVYIFGNSFSDNQRYITDDDDVVHIEIDPGKMIWQFSCLSMALYDRRYKAWLSQ